MQLLNMQLLRSPENWARVWFILALGFAGVFLIAHFVTPASVEGNAE